MSTPALSVVIPLLDSPVLSETLAALGRQSVPAQAFEVVVVGRDRYRQVPRDGSIAWHETPAPVPPAAARNLGVKAARGRLLLFTDADCRPCDRWIEHLAAALEHSEVAGGAVTFPSGGDRWALADNIASFHELLADRPAERASSRPLGSLNLGVRREAWERVGPFDEELVTSEDFDWVLRARKAGLATAFVPEALVEHAAIRRGRGALEEHAAWYGRHFHAFCRRHPGLLDNGPTWRNRRLFALAAPLKALVSGLRIFARHPQLRSSLRALPGVVRFRLAWYRAVLASWHERQTGKQTEHPTGGETGHRTERQSERQTERRNGRVR